MVPIADACVVDRFSVLAWVSLPDTELAIVISRPSRIQAVPSPSTSRVWNGDHLSRSSRAGMVLRTGCCCCCLAATVAITDFLSCPGLAEPGSPARSGLPVPVKATGQAAGLLNAFVQGLQVPRSHPP